MARQRLYIPFAGVANAAPFEDQRGGVVPVGSLRNLILYDRTKDRPRMGTRWGVRKFSQVNMGAGPVQAIKSVESATAQVGLKANACVAVTGGTSIESGPYTGHAFILDRDISPNGHYQNSQTTAEAAFACAWAKHDPDLACFGTIYLDSYNVSGLTMINTAERTVLWEAECRDKDTPGGIEGTRDIYLNQIAIGETHTFVAAYGFVYVFKTDTGAYLKRYNLGGWAFEAMGLAINSVNDLVVCFYGTAAAATLPNNAATQDPHGSQFVRSGIFRYTLTGNDTEPLTFKPYPAKLATGASWYESAHGTIRFSEHLARAPRGCIPYAFAIGPNDEMIVGFTNQGWGWSTDYPPDGSVPYTTVASFSVEGTKLWEVDTDSMRRSYVVGSDTYYNDIPVGLSANGTPDPSVNALAVDDRGDIFAAGLPNAAGYNVFKIRGLDGTILWRAKLGGFVEQHAIAIDPSDGNLWVAPVRNNTWFSLGVAGVGFIQLAKLRTTDGAVIGRFDMRTASKDPFMVACNERGDVIFVSECLT